MSRVPAVPESAAEQFAALEALGVRLEPTRLDLDPALPFEAYERIGWLLGRLRDLTAWAFGDWLLFGEYTFGELAAQAVEVTGRRKDTLLQYVRVARQVPPPRRRATVPWSHHQAVAALPPEEQDRLLDLAERDRLSLEEFRSIIRDAPTRRLAGQNRPPAAEVVELVWDIGRSVLRAAVPLGDGYARVPVDALDRLANALDEPPVVEAKRRRRS